MIGRGRVPGGAAAGALCALALFPFEPRRPTLAVLGFELTLLEMAVGLAVVALLLNGRHELGERLRHPPAPVAALAAFAAVHLVSAAVAPANRYLAAKFALRMCAAAAFAFAVSLAPAAARRRGLLALVGSTAVVAVLAALEWYPVRPLRPFLDLFREGIVVVGSTRRVTAGSEYPNLAAAFLMYGLVAAAALAPDPRGREGGTSRAASASVLLFLLLAGGLVLTYSRGAIVAAAIGLLAVAFARRETRGWLVPATALSVLVGTMAGMAWLEPAFRVRLLTLGTEGWYGARYELPEASLRLIPGESHRLPVRVVNTGRDTWTVPGSFSLGHRWEQVGQVVSERFGIPLDQDVPPGGSALVTVALEAPGTPGRYSLVLDVVQGHLGWFSRLGSRPGTVTVVVGTASADPGGPAGPTRPDVETNVSAEWKPGRVELGQLALEMWRSRPVLGVGPDNFRWLHGSFAGRSASDPRTFSNNTLLEVASTTGSLGLFAFLATVAYALSGAYRQAARSAATPFAFAIFGLLVAFVAHGLLDYVLAFTGHYLVFAFLIGAATPGGREDAVLRH